MRGSWFYQSLLMRVSAHMFSKSGGFSLLSVLISMLLSSLIIILLTREYLTVKQHQQRIQQSIDDALDMQHVAGVIRSSILQAGFTPCLGINHLEAIDARNAKQPLIAIYTAPVTGALHINRMSSQFEVVTKLLSSTQLSVSPLFGIKPDKPIMVADCYHAEVHNVAQVVTHSNEQILTLQNPLLFNYEMPVYIGEWINEVFFIHKGARGALSLYYKGAHTDELSSTIKAMTINILTRMDHVFLTVVLHHDPLDVSIDAMVRG